jgi:hypothetical protein
VQDYATLGNLAFVELGPDDTLVREDFRTYDLVKVGLDLRRRLVEKDSFGVAMGQEEPYKLKDIALSRRVGLVNQLTHALMDWRQRVHGRWIEPVILLTPVTRQKDLARKLESGAEAVRRLESWRRAERRVAPDELLDQLEIMLRLDVVEARLRVARGTSDRSASRRGELEARALLEKVRTWCLPDRRRCTLLAETLGLYAGLKDLIAPTRRE